MSELNGLPHIEQSEVDDLPTLPTHWCRATVGSLASSALIGLDRGRASQRSDPIGVPYIKMGNISTDGAVRWDDLVYVSASEEEVKRFGVESGDLLFNTRNSRELVGKVGYVPSPLPYSTILFNNNLMRLRLHAGIDPRFICYQMVAPDFRRRLDKVKRSTTNVAAVYAKDLLPLPLELPPTNEQRRIVAKIEELYSDLDAGVAALERAKANLKRYRAAVLKAAVEGKLTAEWRAKHPKAEPASKLLERILIERRQKWEADQLAKFAAAGKEPPKNWKAKYVEPTPPDTTDLPELPDGWCWTSLGQCFEVCVGATPSRKVPNYWNGTIPWVSSGEVQFCRIADTREQITAEGVANCSTKLNPQGSVLLGMIGEGKTRGQVAILDIEACNNQNCAAIWVSQTPIGSTYVYCWLWSQYEITRRQSSGNNQPALNKKRVEGILLPLSPLSEQEQIVTEVEERLSQIAAAEKQIDASLLRAARLRQSILKQAFEGKLVPQDPRDEPASALLERIAARSDEAGNARSDQSERIAKRSGKSRRTRSDESARKNRKSKGDLR